MNGHANGDAQAVNGHHMDPYPSTDIGKKDEISYDWANGFFTDYLTGQIEQSNKFRVCFEILEQTILAGERMLLFSQSLLTLDLIEEFLQQRQVPSKFLFIILFVYICLLFYCSVR